MSDDALFALFMLAGPGALIVAWLVVHGAELYREIRQSRRAPADLSAAR